MWRGARNETGADVLHGHGAKGGAYARLTGRGAIRVYTPHGGSLHYGRASAGRAALPHARTGADGAHRTVPVRERATAATRSPPKSARRRSLVRVVHNGVTQAEFADIAPQPDATDVVFIGELRHLKGVDVLIDALAILARDGRTSATIIGAGPDAEQFRAQAERLGLGSSIRFLGAMPARDGFSRGRVMVAPSRAESLPYIVLEAAAAAVPLITTNVGGIPEVFGPQSARLIPPGRRVRSGRGDPRGARRPAATCVTKR